MFCAICGQSLCRQRPSQNDPHRFWFAVKLLRWCAFVTFIKKRNQKVLTQDVEYCIMQGVFYTPYGGLNPNFCTIPLASSPDKPPNSSHGVLLNIVIGIVLMVHQALKPPSDTPGLSHALSSTPPSYQILENTLNVCLRLCSDGFSICYSTVTLNFHLLNSNFNTFISVP